MSVTYGLNQANFDFIGQNTGGAFYNFNFISDPLLNKSTFEN